ncbi:S-adenosyl-L-methionine-dependent methyltransferase [Aulographum hederae CBS 113979]|uniref:S-adenosyl-L-methionine-dependent methyltransferase n=1 Tax=Aulographum hederae CBS 113979 TaxID=1176131 RepID=A0A6G1HF62_9PEZI|nr:S-adenosyl-L-methionine-dependent methyltransferase [Aulographum hederae CBS 113979]
MSNSLLLAKREPNMYHVSSTPTQTPSHHSFLGPEADSSPSTSDTDSALGSFRSTRSTSLTSSIYAYHYENGRRYHAPRSNSDTQYLLPNDEPELDRLDLQHQLFCMTLDGSLHAAPLSPDIQTALDVGTGTGIWAIDFADKYPSASVIGMDLSPVQPAYVPPNLTFYIEDAEADGPWSFDSGSFDYIHGRMIIVGIKAWPAFFARAFDALKPGGWLEIQDLQFPFRCDDGSAGPESPFMKWSDHMMAGAAAVGVDLCAGARFEEWLKEAGFVDVAVQRFAWPVGRWPRDEKMKEWGMWCQMNFLEGVHGFTMGFVSRGLKWSKEEIEVFLADVRKQVKNVSSHIYIPIFFFMARKPMEGEVA